MPRCGAGRLHPPDPAVFDAAAAGYDAAFSETAVGRAQRAAVHAYLAAHLPPGPLDVLELGCGTGLDAAWLLGRGHRVLATDGSPAMLERARARAPGARFQQVDLRELDGVTGPFDLVFSDFGALNVLAPDELPALGSACARLLGREAGRCWWRCPASASGRSWPSACGGGRATRCAAAAARSG